MSRKQLRKKKKLLLCLFPRPRSPKKRLQHYPKETTLKKRLSRWSVKAKTICMASLSQCVRAPRKETRTLISYCTKISEHCPTLLFLSTKVKNSNADSRLTKVSIRSRFLLELGLTKWKIQFLEPRITTGVAVACLNHNHFAIVLMLEQHSSLSSLVLTRKCPRCMFVAANWVPTLLSAMVKRAKCLLVGRNLKLKKHYLKTPPNSDWIVEYLSLSRCK